MSKGKVWTIEEDNILVQSIKDNPHNRVEAFKKAATQLHNRTIKGCTQRWYSVLSNPESKRYVGCTFVTLGFASKQVNRSVYKKDMYITPTKSNKTLWSKIRKLLGIK